MRDKVITAIRQLNDDSGGDELRIDPEGWDELYAMYVP